MHLYYKCELEYQWTFSRSSIYKLETCKIEAKGIKQLAKSNWTSLHKLYLSNVIISEMIIKLGIRDANGWALLHGTASKYYP